MSALLLAGMLMATTPTLEIASGDWSNVPLLKNNTFTDIISPTSIAEVHRLLGEEGCSIPGQNKRRLNLDVPFLVQYAQDGSVSRVVVRRLGCVKVEQLIGSALLDLAVKKQYKATGTNDAGWYRGELNIVSS